MSDFTIISYPGPRDNALLSLADTRSRYMLPIGGRFRVIEGLTLSAGLREWIHVAGGRMKIADADFAALAQTVIVDMHRTTPKGQRPDPDLFTGRLYDALDRAGVAVTLQVRRSSMR